MTLFVPLRASLASTGRLSHVGRKLFSSDAKTGIPLLLWLSDSDESATSSDDTTPPPRILMPTIPTNTSKLTVSSPQDVVQAVDDHYSLSNDSQQFVGGMGESDAGVWFVPYKSDDPLAHYPLIQESIYAVKQSRHGVPFGTFTSGVNLPTDLPPLSDIGLDRIEVSLLAANPKDYATATGLSDGEATKYFGQVCGYCVTLAETGFPLEVSVLQQYASSARDLAVSLGAIHVHVYNNDE